MGRAEGVLCAWQPLSFASSIADVTAAFADGAAAAATATEATSHAALDEAAAGRTRQSSCVWRRWNLGRRVHLPQR